MVGEILGNSNQDLRVMVTESLIKAVEMRLDKTSNGATGDLLEKAIGSGALLTRHFYEGLEKFEKKREGFSVYYRNLLDDLDTDKIRVVLENLEEIRHKSGQIRNQFEENSEKFDNFT